MKKLRNFLAISMILLTIIAFGQGYGGYHYRHYNSLLNAAVPTGINSSGFVVAGIIPGATGNDDDFTIQKTDVDGKFATGTFFSKTYEIQTDPQCGTSFVNSPHGCTGVDIVETNPGNNVQYAIAGAFSEGLFFSTLDASGTPLNTIWWPTTAGTSNNKPSITESAANPGDYYICFENSNGAYVIKIDYTFNILWSRGFTNQIRIEPRDLIESPYNNEVIIVGRCDPGSNPALNAEAFFLRLDAGTGNPVANMTLYSDGGSGDEWFTSIKIAASPTGGSGFVLGGHCHSSILQNTGYQPWIIKLDPTGAVIWSTLIQHGISSFPLEVGDVVERVNWFSVVPYPGYEYFAVANTPVGTSDYMTIWKVDDNGGDSFVAREFSYAQGAVAPWITPTRIDVMGTGLGAYDGIVAWGTYSSTINSGTSSNAYKMVKAYFNGVNNCETQDTWVQQSGPGVSISINLTGQGLSDCAGIQLVSSTGPGETTDCGWLATVSGGSNLRSTIPTLLEDNGHETAEPNIHPNPASGILTVEMGETSEHTTQLLLVDALGQVVIEKEYKGEAHIDLHLNDYNLQDGIYFVNIRQGSKNSVKKIIYSR